uniref:Minor capsid protein P11 C-terminal conserved region domain-containing protein n=1 Tax=viral metagenome TaxID=1070528 RepID=A0A6C0EUS4_9ZZZZ
MKLNKIINGSNKKVFNILLGLGIVVVIVVLFNYNNNKGSVMDNMYDQGNSSLSMDSSSNAVTPSSTDQNNFLPVSGLNTSNGSSSCNNQQVVNPSDLLPKDGNSEWSNINPANADLKNLNLLSAGQLIGINTVGSSLRNPNMQERSEPVIPKANIGPWNNSTIDADTLRRPLEIGGFE